MAMTTPTPTTSSTGTIPTSVLRGALSRVRHLTTGHRTMPILSCVHMAADSGVLRLSATDLTVTMTVKIPCPDSWSWVTVTDHKTLTNAAKTSGNVALDTIDDYLTVTTVHGVVIIPGQDPDQYPLLPTVGDTNTQSIDPAVLRRALGLVIPTAAASPKSDDAHYRCIRVVGVGLPTATAHCVVTTRTTLAVVDLRTSLESLDIRLMLPTARALAADLAKSTTVTVHREDDLSIVRTDTTTYMTRGGDPYPDYLPLLTFGAVNTSAEVLHGLLITTPADAVSMSVTTGALRITATGVDCSAPCVGHDSTIGSYRRDQLVLALAKHAGSVWLHYESVDRPLVITADDGLYTTALMPLRVAP